MGKFKNEPFITQREGKNGWSFQVFIRTQNGSITKTFSERKYGSARTAYDCAVLFKNKTLVDIANKTVLLNSHITVQEVFDDYIEHTVLSCNTKEKHVQSFNRYIPFKNKTICSLSRADIVEVLNSMVYECSDDTIQRILSIIKNDIVNYALLKEYISKDICLGVVAPRSKVIRIKKETTTDRTIVLEVERLIQEKLQNSYDSKLCVYLIELLYFTGMRPAEAEALTKSDINLKDGFISINKQLGSSSDKMHVVTRCKTNQSVRKVPIHPQLKPILEELIELSDNECLFLRQDGNYLNSDFVGSTIYRVIRGTGIEFNLYRCRHNMATSLVSNLTDARTTMDILGHANYSMSLEYANSSKHQKEEAINRLH